MKPLVRHEKDVALSEEGPFPAKIFLSKQDSPSASVKLGTLERGKKIESHMHYECDQLEYYIGGRALMSVEGLGEREIREGSFTYIPKGVKHGILKVTEPLTIITVFAPALF